MPTVRIKNGPSLGSVFEIGDAPLVLGRDDRAEIPVSDQGVSRRHAELYRIGDMYFIRDLGSRNGTFVNEERITEELLRDGDEVRIASTIFLFESSDDRAVPPPPRKRNRVRLSPGTEATSTIQIDEHLSGDAEDLAEPDDQERSRDLQLLYACSQAISDARDATQLCERLVEQIGEALEADHVCIFVRKEGSRELELEATYQAEHLIMRGAPVVARRVILEVVQQKRGVLATGEKVREPEAAGERASPGAMRPSAVAAAPLVAREQVHGVLYCASEEADRFQQEELDLVSAIALQIGIALQSLSAAQRLERILISTVRTLSTLLEMRDATYKGHSGRVSAYCSGIAQALKVPRSESRRIQLAALLHNVGKIVLPPEQAVEDDPKSFEYQLDVAERLISRIEGLDFVLPIIATYRENVDGTGIPGGLKGDDIPLGARILAVADRLDTLVVRGETAQGPPLEPREAFRSIRSEAGTRFDPTVVDALMLAQRAGYLGGTWGAFAEDAVPADEPPAA